MAYRKKIILFAAVVIVLTAVGCFGQRFQKVSVAAKPKDALTINVVPMLPQDVVVTNEFIGYVIPIQAVDIKPNVSGYVDKIWVSGGQRVSAGENLARIDQKEYKAQLDAAQAAVVQAKAAFDNAEHYYKRMTKAGKKAVSAAALDDAQAQFLSAEAALKQAQAEEKKARTLYDYTILKSPIDGIVGHIDVTKGNYAAPTSEALFSVIQFNPIRVEFAISDKEYLTQRKKYPDGALFQDEKIQIRLADNTVYEQDGRFKFTNNSLDKDTNSVSIFADFKNTDNKLLPNSYVDILVSKKLNDVFLIRQNYVTLSHDGAFVHVMKDGKISKIPLYIKDYYQDYFVVENRFDKNEFLIIDKLGDIQPETRLTMKIAQTEEQ